MWIRTEALHVAKRGNTEREYEDAFFPRARACELSRFRCAVADGASESAFSGLWARLLVTSFGRGRMHLAHLRQVWQRAVAPPGPAQANGNGKALPWYLQNKVANGAHAAFVGISIRDGRIAGAVRAAAAAEAAAANGDGGKRSWLHKKVATEPVVAPVGTWRSLAVGDSCIFQVREGNLVCVGPLGRSELFDNSPFLIASKTTTALYRGDENVSVLTGTWAPGDVFYLATDAISKWLLAEHEAGRPKWALLRALGSETFAPLVSQLRESGALHNDDTTVMRVEVA